MKYAMLIFILIGFLLSGNVAAQHTTHQERVVERYKSNWSRLIPRQTKIQYAGSMGMFSFGPGWYYGRKNQWETDWFIGFIPEINGAKGHITTTLKQTYTPFQIALGNRIVLEPLTSAIYINKIFGPYFWSKLPEKYPKNYYFWAVNTRFNISFGQAITVNIRDCIVDEKLSAFYEFSTNDLYIISAIGNKAIGIGDIIGLSLGIRYRVF